MRVSYISKCRQCRDTNILHINGLPNLLKLGDLLELQSNEEDLHECIHRTDKLIEKFCGGYYKETGHGF